MKKFFAMMLCVIMVFGLVACDGNPGVSIPEGGVFTQPEETAVMSREDAVKAVEKRYRRIVSHAGEEYQLLNPNIVQGDGDQSIVVFVFDNGGLDEIPYTRMRVLMSYIPILACERYVGVIQYDEIPHIKFPMTKPVSDDECNECSRMLNANTPGTEGAAMYDAIIVGLKMLVDAQEYAPSTTLKLVLASSGHTDVSSRSGGKEEEVISLAIGLGVQIYTCAFYAAEGDDAQVNVLKKLADSTGAKCIVASDRDTLEAEWGQLVREILQRQ